MLVLLNVLMGSIIFAVNHDVNNPAVVAKWSYKLVQIPAATSPLQTQVQSLLGTGFYMDKYRLTLVSRRFPMLGEVSYI